MRDYSTINRSFTNRCKRRTSLPSSIDSNNENILNGQQNQANDRSKSIKKEKIIKPKVRIQPKNNGGLKGNSNDTGIKRSPIRTALGNIKQGSFMKKPQSSVVVPEKGNIEDDKSDNLNTVICNEKETKNVSTDIITPAAKKLRKSEDKSVEATNDGYASVSKLAEWLKERPFDSTKKVTRTTVPSSCPVTHRIPAIRKDLNGTKKTLFSTGENGKAGKPASLQKSKLPLKPIPPTLPPQNKGSGAKSGARVCRPPNGSHLNFHVKKETKDEEEVQATNTGYASVSKLSHWLAEKPFEKKKAVIVSRKGKMVLEKSLAFEPDQPVPTEYVIHSEITKHNNVSERKNWLQNQAFSKDI